MSSRSFIGRIQRHLSRHPFCVRAAVKLRNQCACVIGFHLGEDIRAEFNGELQLLKYIAPHARTFVDVGANVGDWTESFLSFAPSNCKGLSVDANTSAIKTLRSRLPMERVEVLHMALSDQPGEMEFSEEENAGVTSSLVQSFSRGTRTTKVTVSTVDVELEKRGIRDVDFLKIDTEGYDLHVLRGCEKLLTRKGARVVQFEYNQPWANAGSTLFSALTMFQQLGYRSFLLRSTGLHPFNYERFGEFFKYSNFVAVTPEGLELVREFVR